MMRLDRMLDTLLVEAGFVTRENTSKTIQKQMMRSSAHRVKKHELVEMVVDDCIRVYDHLSR